MGSMSGEFLANGRRLSCSGHQCWFAIEPVAAWGWLITGHLAPDGAASSDVVAVLPVSSLMVFPLSS